MLAAHETTDTQQSFVERIHRAVKKLKKTKWTRLDQIRRNGLNKTRHHPMDQIGPKRIE